MDRRNFIQAATSVAATTGLRGSSSAAFLFKQTPYQVAAYYFPNFHVDPRNEVAHGPGWTEWRLVDAARPRFPGHQQPRVPLWGGQDESDPMVFSKKIDAAADAGLTALIFDWYWYEDAPFLERALQNGYLQAKNNDRLKFALMWANHDWYDLMPAKLIGPPRLQYRGAVSEIEFSKVADHLVGMFSHPSYWRINGRPYFSIYSISSFVQGMGGVSKAAEALKTLRAKAVAAGLPDLHLNAITRGFRILPGQSEVADVKGLIAALGLDSTTSYVWVHHAELGTSLTASYEAVRKQYEAHRDGASREFARPYFPNVTVGWDSSPRSCQTDIYRIGAYPFTPAIQGNTPEAFRRALESAKLFADQNLPPEERIITVNSWNEWTEGSYLEPDTEHKFGYLDQIRSVFS